MCFKKTVESNLKSVPLEQLSETGGYAVRVDSMELSEIEIEICPYCKRDYWLGEESTLGDFA